MSLVDAWNDVRESTLAALADPAVPSRMITTPLGELDGSFLLDVSVVEPLVHGWDLARAIGVDATLDDELAARCLEIAEQYGFALRGPGMYGAAQPVPEDASTGERLLAFLGRETSTPAE